MKQRRSLGIVLILMIVIAGLALVATGCRSFEESVKPLITPQAPEGYKRPIYMTGTITADEVDPAKANVEVWRVNSNPYPDSVQLFVRVFDNEGHIVTKLAPPYYTGSDDYRKIWSGLTEQIGLDGQPQQIEQFSVREYSDQDGIPYELALVLDYSGTMGTNIAALEQGATAFVKLKRAQDRIAVVKFDKKPQLVVRSTGSESELLSTFKGGLAGYGTYTALYGAAKLGAEQLVLAPPANPRAIVLFTDGEDNASTVVASEVYKYSIDNNIPIFTIAFGPVNRDVLSDISTVTGGKFYQTYTPDELKMAFEDIYRSLRNYYVVTYRPVFAIGRHMVKLTLTPPRSTTALGANAEYNTLTGAIARGDRDFNPGALFFDYNQATLKPESRQAIDNVVMVMKERPRLKIEVRGHTDAVGGDEFNQKLSDARASAVRDAIVAAGIDPSRIQARGLGLTQPLATNDTEEGRAKNRRTEFVILRR